MLSKEIRAYNWVLKVAFRHLLGDTILSYNQCKESAQKLAMYQHIRAMMRAVLCLKSHGID